MTLPEQGDFPPHVLREYVLLADGERGAVLGPRGDIVWMCAPRWDSDAVFSSLIGGMGAYAVTPLDRWTHSRLISAAGLRAIAGVQPSSGDAVDWISQADRIVADTSERALDPQTGSWKRAPDDGRLDAALLLVGLRGAVPDDDPRTLATHQQGDVLAAHGWFERTRAACGPPQLYCEEYDAVEHQMRGNFPQAFVHALMIEAAACLAKDPERSGSC